MRHPWLSLLLLAALCGPDAGRAGEIIRVATYNLDNYLAAPASTRPAKSLAQRARVREAFSLLRADVVALQEIGGASALSVLRESLETEGLTYPHWELVHGWDTNIQVAVLSRFPIVARRPHTNDSFLLFGRRYRVSRGFAEVDIQVNPAYRFTLITAHLKSRRPVPEADEAELREQEALLLREKINARFRADPNVNLVVLGDFNDVKDSPSIKAIRGRGRTALVDIRPAERNGDDLPSPDPRQDLPHITWTHYYAKEDTYGRIDYIFLSRGMAREWLRQESCVLAFPNWGQASDHRPVLAGFAARDR